MKILAPIMAAALLVGCASAPTVAPEAEQLRPLPSGDMSECPAPTPLQGPEADARDIAEKLGEVASLYKECRRSKKALIEWIEDGRTTHK